MKQTEQQIVGPEDSDRIVRFPRTWEHAHKSELIASLQEAHKRGDAQLVRQRLVELQELVARVDSRPSEGLGTRFHDLIPIVSQTRNC
jgi:hypothetical protein